MSEGKASQTVTVLEMEEAIERLGDHDRGYAQDIYENIVKYREPAWQEGDIIKSDANITYMRYNGEWIRFGVSRTYPDSFPTRPLTRLKFIEDK